MRAPPDAWYSIASPLREAASGGYPGDVAWGGCDVSGLGLAGRSIAALHEGYRRRDFSPLEVLDDLLNRARGLEAYNAFATIDAEGARMAARASDGAGALRGIPLSAKDLLNVKGMVTAFGSRTMANNVAARDCHAVAGLRSSGAVIFGKTTTPEFGHKVLTDSPLHGVTRNPWNPERSSGGSSGGAAVAVSLGLGPVAIASDGAGSARIPAACCGVYGLKPTLGLVAHDTTADVFNLMLYIGAMARHPADLLTALDAMSGPCGDDPWSVAAGRRPRAAAHSGDALAGRRFVVVRRMFDHYLDPAVEGRLDAAIRFVEERGGVVRELPPGGFDWGNEAARRLMRANQYERYRHLLTTRRDELDPSFAQTLEEGRAVTVDELRAALGDRTALFRRVNALFGEADYLLTPTVTTTALPAIQDAQAPLVVDGKARGSLRDAWYVYTIPFNLTGHPAISMPFGFDAGGMPIGLQAVAPWYREADLVALAQAFDGLTGASTLPPPALGATS